MNKDYQKFEMGQLVATPAALAAMDETNTDYYLLLKRHLHGDWGIVDAEDKRSNDFASKNDERILSAYRLTDTQKVWIITERDRSVTTILLPSEY